MAPSFCFVLLVVFVVVTSSRPPDWLTTDLNTYPEVTLNTDCKYNDVFDCIELSNSLISRKFIISPNFFTIEYNSHLGTGIGIDYILRSPFSPEAIIGINNVNYSIGGVSYINNSDTTAAFWSPQFLNESNIKINETTWIYDSYSISKRLNKIYEWTPGTRHSFSYINWPPKGLQLTVLYRAPKSLNQPFLTISVIYEMYQGMPLLSKQVMIKSSSPSNTANVNITYVQIEQLKTNVPYGMGEKDFDYWTPDQNDHKWDFMNQEWGSYPGWLWMQNDFAHLTEIRWYEDPDKQYFKTNNYGGYEPMVVSNFAISDEQTNWSVRLDPSLPGTENGVFKSFRTFELIFDSFDWERQSLGMRRLMTYMTPAITEAPIYTQTMNMTNASVYRIIDQCAESGFEMLAFSFYSGFNMFTENKTDIDYYQSLIAYGHSKGIEVGGYNLEDMGVNMTSYNRVEVNGDNKQGACMCSGWIDELTGYVDNWVDIGGDMFITDGPYPGWSCASHKHEYHDGIDDSTFRQIYAQQQWYLKYRNENIYIHSPDPYYFYGINRNKYQYNEYTTTLPRWWDLTIYRQLMFDESYIIPVTAGWMFLPSVSYHEGDSEAVFEPLHAHLNDYSFALGQYFSYSVAATIRGFELWDTEETKQVVVNWVNYYKKYRQILMSDIVHIQRPNNINIDAILHVNPMLVDECGMLIVFNPINQTLFNQSLELNLYYTGVKKGGKMSIAVEEKRPFTQIQLTDEYYYTLYFDAPARNLTYFIFDCSN